MPNTWNVRADNPRAIAGGFRGETIGTFARADDARLASHAPAMREALRRVIEAYGVTHKGDYAIEKAWQVLMQVDSSN